MKTLGLLMTANLSFSILSYSQTSITLQPTPAQGKDAMVYSCVPCGYDNTNYGNKKDFDAMAWTNGGNFGIARSLMQFDLSSVPANVLITDARLSLYYNSTSIEGYHSGINAAYLQRIIAPWTESTVTWNNQPGTTTYNQVLIPTTTNNSQNCLNINVTNFICDMVNNPGSNHGFMLRLVTENGFRKLIFASSDNVSASLRPKLVITYTTPLPIELTNFKVQQNNNTNKLTWSTASEINNDGFDIERSITNNMDFEKIGFVQGAGNSTQPHRYEFTDNAFTPKSGCLYRLKQIDFDGTVHFSEIVHARGITFITKATAGPNPFRENAKISFSLSSISQVQMDVFDSRGNHVKTVVNSKLPAGSQELLFDPKAIGLGAGLYHVNLLIDGELSVFKLVYVN